MIVRWWRARTRTYQTPSSLVARQTSSKLCSSMRINVDIILCLCVLPNCPCNRRNISKPLSRKTAHKTVNNTALGDRQQQFQNIIGQILGTLRRVVDLHSSIVCLKLSFARSEFNGCLHEIGRGRLVPRIAHSSKPPLPSKFPGTPNCTLNRDTSPIVVNLFHGNVHEVLTSSNPLRYRRRSRVQPSSSTM